jgi:hypothetical protein
MHRLRDHAAAEAGRLLRLLLLRLGSLPANTSGAPVLRLGEAGVAWAAAFLAVHQGSMLEKSGTSFFVTPAARKS